ncbi:uncharacterized protein LOC133893232 [Phragmites australis]|uniref:uncharacterized protein LOC133893232 n=1 Tax=Phragmites australis TaxID=29695 RepID=UPI002D7669FF|nr:uncharacterized protein LOC133893232 [Phragmites australis]
MARDTMHEVSQGEASRWQQRPEEPEVRDVAVDPFSLRQFSQLDIDKPLPIPSVAVADRRLSPARFGSGSVSVPSPAASSPRVSNAGRLKAPAAATGWYDAPAAHWAPTVQAPSTKLPRSKSSASGEMARADGELDDVFLSSERKASEPQRWGSDVPLIASAGAGAEEEDSTGYAIGEARGKNGRGKGKHGGEAPFTCCMYLPGITRRSKPPATAVAAARSSSGVFGKAFEEEYPDPGTARPSTMSLAVSLERFDCGSMSTSSWRGLALDGEASSSSYFDLPLELILGCDDDESDLPVCAAFVFDSDGIRKSVLKKRLEPGSGAAPRPSLRISASQVRFSLTSSSAPAPTSL